MVILLILVIGLVIWSLHLLQESVKLREFSLMLAGTLVAISAAGVVVVYLLMDGCLGYLAQAPHPTVPSELYAETLDSGWLGPIEVKSYPCIPQGQAPVNPNQNLRRSPDILGIAPEQL